MDTVASEKLLSISLCSIQWTTSLSVCHQVADTLKLTITIAYQIIISVYCHSQML